jgi:hypothetical protein
MFWADSVDRIEKVIVSLATGAAVFWPQAARASAARPRPAMAS